MAITFGAAASDFITTPSLNWLSANSVTFISLWCYPTTLTAGRCLWGDGASAATQLEIDTTTTQLRLRMRQATTNSVQTLSHPDIPLAINDWFFIAVALASSGGTTQAQTSAWIGTSTQPPLPMTVATVTAGSGGYTAAVNLAIGQSATINAAWQGDIENLFFAASTSGQGGLPFGGSLPGAWTTDDVDQIYRRFVQPLWAGRPDQLQLLSNTVYRWRWHPLIDAASYYIDCSSRATPVTTAATVSGSLPLSTRRAPRACPQAWLYQAIRKPGR